MDFNNYDVFITGFPAGIGRALTLQFAVKCTPAKS